MHNDEECGRKATLMTYKQIAKDSGLGINTIRRLAKESNSLLKIGKSARIDSEIFYHYVKTVYRVQD